MRLVPRMKGKKRWPGIIYGLQSLSLQRKESAFTRGERAENWGLGTGRSLLEKTAAGLA